MADWGELKERLVSRGERGLRMTDRSQLKFYTSMRDISSTLSPLIPSKERAASVVVFIFHPASIRENIG